MNWRDKNIMPNGEVNIDETEEARRGELLATALNLRKSRTEGRYLTTYGTKTALGLYRTVQRIILDGDGPVQKRDVATVDVVVKQTKPEG